DNRTNNTISKLLECVDLDGVREHQAAFQAIADANGDTRASGTPGYDASVDYVVERMAEAGYDVTVQEFEFSFFDEDSALERISPAPRVYQDQVTYDTMTFSGEGDVTAQLEAVDLALADPTTSSSACEASDFAGFTAGNIALAQRGACAFGLKEANAAAAGAAGIIIMNQGDDPDDPARTGLLFGTLGAQGTIPAMGISFFDGVELADLLASGDVTMRMFVDVESGIRTSFNVLAETQQGDTDNVVMVGAHLDSVTRGPGINDNGSGSAAILEVAEQMAKVKPTNQVRFAWWGSEEFGLLGSSHYVAQLSEAELDEIALYLNFDMVGSPNYVRFIYDGDGSAFGLVGPDGSDDIEAFFEDFYAERELASEPSEISFRSDYAAFFTAGIPFGGLFTGAEGIKTPEQAAVYGGTAGQQYDPCYHQACDTLDNVSLEVLDLNSDAIAAATLTYAMNTESINEQSGKGNFKPDQMGPEPRA
ncbi:MAG: M28 family metallopeptidase, partial [Acidimicrobiia bacterium]